MYYLESIDILFVALVFLTQEVQSLAKHFLEPSLHITYHQVVKTDIPHETHSLPGHGIRNSHLL